MIEILFITFIILGTISFFTKNRKSYENIQILFSCFLLLLVLCIYILDLPATYLLPQYFFLDYLNIILLTVISIIFFGVTVYEIKNNQIIKGHKKEYNICLFGFIFSMLGALLSKHLALLWVFIELTTVFSTFLIWSDRSKKSLEAAWKYLFICSVGVSLAFVGIILLSLSAGNLFFDELYTNTGNLSAFWLKISFVFMLVGFGTKMGLAPMHSWKADTYSQAPEHISALLASCLVNIAILPIFRIFKLMDLAGLNLFASNLLLLTGFLSLLFSALYLIQVKNYKRMLAYSSIENAGIIMIALSLSKPGLIIALIHIISHSFAKASLFLSATTISQIYKSDKISDVNNLLIKAPKLALIWILSFLAIACLPPFLSFVSEFYIIKSFLINKQYLHLIMFLSLTTFIIYRLALQVFKMSFNGSNKEIYPASIKVQYISFVFILILIISTFILPKILFSIFPVGVL